MSTNPDMTRQQLLFLAALTEGGLGVVACLVGWPFGFYPWEQIRWEPMAFVRGLLITLPMLVMFFVCVLWPVGPLRPIKQFVDQVVKPLFSQCTIFDLAVIALLAGFGEELLFRGLIQPVAIHWLGLVGGLLIASILFGLAHPITPGYVLMATGVGLYLGWFAYAFDNLLEVILAHALYDFIGLVFLTWGSRKVLTKL